MGGLKRMEPELPPLEELESIRQLLIQQIAEAELMFSAAADGTAYELLTIKSALSCIEELIESAKQRQAA